MVTFQAFWPSSWVVSHWRTVQSILFSLCLEYQKLTDWLSVGSLTDDMFLTKMARSCGTIMHAFRGLVGRQFSQMQAGCGKQICSKRAQRATDAFKLEDFQVFNSLPTNHFGQLYFLMCKVKNGDKQNETFVWDCLRSVMLVWSLLSQTAELLSTDEKW